jgi:hypothetical protein
MVNQPVMDMSIETSSVVEGNMAFKVQVGPPQISIHQGQTILISELDGQINWPSDKGLFFRDTRDRPVCLAGRHGTSGSSPSPDALAGPGIVTHNQHEDRDGVKRVNKPAQYCGHDVEHDANNRS